MNHSTLARLIGFLWIASPFAAAQCANERFVPDDAAERQQFGLRMDVDGDLAVVTAPGDDDRGEAAGSVYVLERRPAGVTRTPDDFGERPLADQRPWRFTTELYGSSPAANQRFGRDVAVDRGRIAVSTQGTREVTIFVRDGGRWAIEDVIPAPTLPGPLDFYGTELDLDGEWLAVSDWGHEGTGAVFLFRRGRGGDWSLHSTLLAETPGNNERFGHALDLDGDRLAVGVPFDMTAEFERQGSVQTFRLVNDVWTFEQRMLGDDRHRNWGWSVGLSGDSLAMSAANGPQIGDNLCGILMFERSGGTWGVSDYLTNGIHNPWTQFGRSLALKGRRLVVTSNDEFLHGAENQILSRGIAHLYHRNAGGWTWIGKRDGMPLGGIGNAVALSGDTILVREELSSFDINDSVQIFDYGAMLAETFCFCFDPGCSNTDPLAGCANATGSGSRLLATGTSSTAADDLEFCATGAEPDRMGILMMGSQATEPMFFNNGKLCLAHPTALLQFASETSDAEGSFRFGPGLVEASQGFPLADWITPGSTWNFQLWYADSGACLTGANLSSAVAVTFYP